MSIQYFETLLTESNIENIAGWLHSISEAERKSLGKELKALSKIYTEYKEVRNFDGSFTYKQKATPEQQHILVLANFVCLSRTEFEKSNFPGWIFDKNILDLVIEWYHPEWLGDFLEKLSQKSQVFHLINYLYIADLEHKGYINLKSGIVCQTLVMAIFEHTVPHKFTYTPENLLKFQITLEKHIWWLFEHESNIHYAGRWIRFADGVANTHYSWITLFTQFINEGRIERGRVLKESLLASNRNFNKILSGWFIELAEALAPTEDELLENQQTICSLLNAPQTKPVNYAINTFKKITVNPNFNASQFLDNAQALMTSPTKSIASGTLMVFDKLLKNQPDKTGNILQLAVNGFIHQDTEVQTKVAKFIVKYSIGSEQLLSEALIPYRDNILSEAGSILKPFLEKDVNEGVHNSAHFIPNESIVEERFSEPIPAFNQFDDLLFLCSRALEPAETWFADILPMAVVINRQFIHEKNADSFSPALKRAFQLGTNSWAPNTGVIDDLLRCFFKDVCIILVKRYPENTKALQSLFRENEEKHQQIGFKWLGIDNRTSYTEGHTLGSYHEFYRLFQQVLVLALHFFKNNIDLPILSTPTHQPSWIDPNTFINRLAEYEAAGYNPDIIDFQIAMARCNLVMTEEVGSSLEKLKNPETKGLLRFLFGLQDQPDKIMQRPELWFMASLCRPIKQKYEAFERYGYYVSPFAKYTGEYDFQTTTTSGYHRFLSYLPPGEKSSLEQITFQIVTPQEEEKEISWFNKIKSKLTLNDPGERVLPEFMQLKEGYLGKTSNDLARALLITPNNMGPLLAGVAGQCLKFSKFWESTDGHSVQATIEILHRTGYISGKMGHVFVATTMICSNKTASGVAAEIWIEGVQHKSIDSSLLGSILGKHYKVDYAPIKRLTDLMQTRMFNISPIHNKALLNLIENLLPELSDTAPPNLKKLLELYNELLTLGGDGETMKDFIRPKLELWGKTKSLESITKKLLKFN